MRAAVMLVAMMMFAALVLDIDLPAAILLLVLLTERVVMRVRSGLSLEERV